MNPGLIPLVVSLLWTQAPAPAATPAAAQGAAAKPSQVPGIAPLPGQPNVWVSNVPPVPDALRRRMEQYLESRTAALSDASDDGKQLLITTRFADTNQLHVVEMPMGARTQITFAKEPINRAVFQPGDANVVYYLQDKGGGEFFQVFKLDRRTGRSELLTDGKSRHEALRVSADGRWLAYAGTGRNGKDTDVYVAPTSEPTKARRLTELEGTYSPQEFSADGSKLLVQRFRAADDSDLFLVDVASGERRQLTPSEGKGSVDGATFTKDGQGVYLVTDRYSDFSELYLLDTRTAPTAAPPPSLTKSVKWSVTDLALSPDGRKLAVAFNEDGYTTVSLLDTRTRALSALTVLPKGVGGGLKFPRKRSDVLALSLGSARSPMDVWTVDLKSRKPTRWTRSEVGGLDTEAFVEPTLVRYPSTDGVQVPALLYVPRNTGGKKVPVVVSFHGGPEGQSRPMFSNFTQFIASELGMAVLVPNVRGSDGYGKAYRAMDDGVKREQSLKDIGATLDFIASRPELDATRVGVSGGSYGGYMTLASVAFYPDRFKAAVDVVGISSLPSFLENTQAYRRDLRRAEYGDERIPEVRRVQERISPLGSVDKIRAALFVQQGANDPRVPQSEAEQIVQAVRQRAPDVWYMLATDEGHGFQKKPTRDYAQMTTMMFFEKHLGAPQVPAQK
ncbi:prolyl oligopeptidase family serine peptidase [Myxococcus sp. XM-1-1-1]|jgi:dipeptidyl aminopeptidase/acylaminoacyl peptidase|uniref:S9 family peptidase n=1 Tax=Myxococcus sp. XM-1-1-1 TaxID=2874602 RepID=UPI001CBEC51E|nr:alpha/beta fold hydrolase [Myxococcus sp. XM-1-1-1]MBZ4413867.1 prolyl oligopeptidase family serine peptidase [Myxococcus sp. XM-1-1-1]